MNIAQTAVLQHIQTAYPLYPKRELDLLIIGIPEHTDPSFTLLDDYIRHAEKTVLQKYKDLLAEAERRESAVLRDLERTIVKYREALGLNE